MTGPKRFIFGLISLHLMMGCTGGNDVCKASIGGCRGACSPTWVMWDGKCYKAITENLKWSQAKDECVKMGSVLAAPRSQEENTFIDGLLPEQPYYNNGKFWINCNDLEEEGTWKCQDGTGEVEYRNWRTAGRVQQPDNNLGNEDCAAVVYGGTWNDLLCETTMPAICIQPAPQLHL